MLELACLYYEVRRCFRCCSPEAYWEAEAEVADMVGALGHTMGELSKLAEYVRWKKIYEA